MGKLIAIIKREYIERVRTKWFLIATLLGPFMFLAITILPVILAKRATASANASRITIIDATGIKLGDRVAEALTDSVLGAPQVNVVAPGEVAAAESLLTRAVLDKSREGYLVMDAQTLSSRKARYTGRNTSTVPDMKRITDALDDAVLAVRLENAGISTERIDSLTNVRVRMEKTQLSSKGREKSGVGSAILGVAVAFLLYIVLLIYGQSVLRSVIEEKSTRVAEVVISSVRPEMLLAGKIIGIGCVALTQMVIWAASSSFLGSTVVPMVMRRTGGSRGGMMPTDSLASAAGGDTLTGLNIPAVPVSVLIATVLFFLLGYIFYSCLYAAVGSTVNSDSEAQQAATPVAMLLVVSAVFIQPVALAPASALSVVMSMIPFSAPLIMPMRMNLMSVPGWQIIGSLVATALSCVAAIWFSARIYRVGLLMYGKRPSLGELVKWLRY